MQVACGSGHRCTWSLRAHDEPSWGTKPPHELPSVTSTECNLLALSFRADASFCQPAIHASPTT